MTKPDDIPQDVMETAIKALYGDAPDEWVRAHVVLISRCARAIMAATEAEREAILQFEFDLPATVTHPSGPAYASGWTDCFIAVREYIRNRSNP